MSRSRGFGEVADPLQTSLAVQDIGVDEQRGSDVPVPEDVAFYAEAVVGFGSAVGFARSVQERGHCYWRMEGCSSGGDRCVEACVAASSAPADFAAVGVDCL